MFRWLKRVRKRTGPTTPSFQLVCKLIHDALDEDALEIPLTPSTRFDELGFDSLRYINFIVGVEEAIHVDIEEIAKRIDLSRIQTIADAVTLVSYLRKDA